MVSKTYDKDHAKAQRAYMARRKKSGIRRRAVDVPNTPEANAEFDRAKARLYKKWGLGNG
jgi:hypothetical protein